eukprot:scaffold165964_cov50-Cyclotella_meneghiniana.AAC.1
MGKHLESEYSNAYVPQKFNNSPIFSSEIALDHVANGVVHPVTKETITKYEKLANDPLLSDVRRVVQSNVQRVRKVSPRI